MTSQPWQSSTRLLCIGLLTCSLFAPAVVAQDQQPGFIIGRVFEVDKPKYNSYMAKQQGQGEVEVKPYEFLMPRGETVVTARQLENNFQFDSDVSNDGGDYMIADTPPGVYEFTLQYEGVTYPVKQRLGVRVDMSYVAELCFVIDREEKVAWMVAAGARRAPEVPAFVPTQCQSQLGACLAMLTGDPIPDGLLLLLAGSAAAATNIGIISTEQEEASPPKKQ